VSRRKIAAVAGLSLVAAVALGPRVTFGDVWVAPEVATDLDAWVAAREAGVRGLRDGDGRGIVWADSARRGRTPVSLVYLHGFSADRHEIEPVVSDLGAALGANVYFTRLAGHGRDGPAMADATVEGWLSDAAEAVEVGARLGERVVLVGTSTGGTLAAWAASRPESRPALAALVLISPNLHPRDRSSRVLLYPWGGHIASLFTGPERCFEPENDRQLRHWTTCYPTAALLPMMALVEYVRTMDVSEIEVPVLVLFSPEDQVVDAEETTRFLERMSGTDVRALEVKSSSDPANHVLAGDIMSPTSTEEVETAVIAFLSEVLGAGGV